jgi:hypothetical protein
MSNITVRYTAAFDVEPPSSSFADHAEIRSVLDYE